MIGGGGIGIEGVDEWAQLRVREETVPGVGKIAGEGGIVASVFKGECFEELAEGDEIVAQGVSVNLWFGFVAEEGEEFFKEGGEQGDEKRRGRFGRGGRWDPSFLSLSSFCTGGTAHFSGSRASIFLSKSLINSI